MLENNFEPVTLIASISEELEFVLEGGSVFALHFDLDLEDDFLIWSPFGWTTEEWGHFDEGQDINLVLSLTSAFLIKGDKEQGEEEWQMQPVNTFPGLDKT